MLHPLGKCYIDGVRWVRQESRPNKIRRQKISGISFKDFHKLSNLCFDIVFSHYHHEN